METPSPHLPFVKIEEDARIGEANRRHSNLNLSPLNHPCHRILSCSLPKLIFFPPRSLFSGQTHFFGHQNCNFPSLRPLAVTANYHARPRAGRAFTASSPLTTAFFKKKEGIGRELGDGDAKNAGPAYADSRTASPTFLGRISGSGLS